MDAADMLSKERRGTERTRRPPGEPYRAHATFHSGGNLGDEIIPGPIELLVEATNADGEIADWFDDIWWMDVLERWGDSLVTVHMLPTPAALLHPVTLHQLEMVVRVAKRWRLVGHAYTSDVTTDEDIVSLAKSPYHDVRFIDQPRPGTMSPARRLAAFPIKTLFSRIRREQQRINATWPILVRLPSSHQSPITDTPARAAREA